MGDFGQGHPGRRSRRLIVARTVRTGPRSSGIGVIKGFRIVGRSVRGTIGGSTKRTVVLGQKLWIEMGGN